MCGTCDKNHRVLVIDDNRAIHEDLRKVLSAPPASDALEDVEALLFGAEAQAPRREQPTFEVYSAYQGQDGIDQVKASLESDCRFALAIVDMRMPPGIGGLETIERILALDSEIQIVICTAYSDSSWEEIVDRFGSTDRLLILRKPFDAAEVCQMALALTEKWRLAREGQLQRQGLSRSLALAESIQNAVLDAILVVDEHRRVVSYNQKFCQLWNIPADLAARGDDNELIGHVLSNLVDADEFVERVGYLYEHPLESCQEEVRLKDGRVFDRWTGPVRGASGYHGRIWCFRDITGQRKMERDRIILSERMASIGRLAAGVGHEINNPLAFVMGNVDFLIDWVKRSGPDASPDDREELESAASATRIGLERIRVVVRDLQTLTRSDDEKLASLDLEAVVEHSVQIAMNEIRHRARLIRAYDRTPRIVGNEARLGQVFLNLLLNAAQALPEGRAEDNAITIRLGTSEDQVIVEVADTGSGIEQRNLARVFDPFFTTKSVGTGTGLGLSICQGIVTSHGGAISVESTVGVGTTFRVSLPRAPAEQPMPKESAAAEQPPKARVLVVDDELHIRQVIPRMFPSLEIVCEASGRGALARIHQGERFDVILCDVMMPELTGMDVHRELRQVEPEMADRLIFMTGGTFSEGANEYLSDCANVLITKPIGRAELTEAIHRTLGLRAA
ncbi:MAG: response regulator [Myxococcota bacterium]